MNSVRLPTANEINVYGSLDEIVASDHFLGKSLSEAESLFRENSLYYQEDLMWMGPRAFQLYLPAATNYLRSSDASGDDHMIDSLYEIVIFRLNQDEFSLAIDPVNEMIDYIIKNYDKFEVYEEVYGDLKAKYVQLREQLGDMI